MGKGPVLAGPGGLRGVALALAVPPDVVADLRQELAVDILEGKAAVADELSALPQRHGPEAEAQGLVAAAVPGDPVPDPGLIEGVGGVAGDVGVPQDGIEGVEVLLPQLPEAEAGRQQFHGLTPFPAGRDSALPGSRG